MNLLPLLLAAHAWAAPLTSDDSFSKSLGAGAADLRLERFARQLGDERLTRELEERLGWYDLMERQPAMDAAQMSAVVLEGARSGRYRSVIFGESHGVAPERAAARRFMGDLLGSVPVGSFLLEAYSIYPDTSAFSKRGIPVILYQTRFEAPEKDAKRALDLAKDRLVVSYIGSAHTAQDPKNYFQNTLLAGLWAGYGPGLKDMPTVENGFKRYDAKPLVVAMISEEFIVRRIQQLFLYDIARRSADLTALRSSLDELQSLWSARFSAWPRRAAPISFARDPLQADLYVGMTPSELRPLEIAAASKVLAMPELEKWLGGARIDLVESLAGSSWDRDGRLKEQHWDVIVHAKGLSDFHYRVVGDPTLHSASEESAEPLVEPQADSSLRPGY